LAAENLLVGDRAFGAAAAEEGDRPAGEHENTVLEPGQPDEMDEEPDEPGGQRRCRGQRR
jgi:hypothetical protein